MGRVSISTGFPEPSPCITSTLDEEPVADEVPAATAFITVPSIRNDSPDSVTNSTKEPPIEKEEASRNMWVPISPASRREPSSISFSRNMPEVVKR